MADIIAVHKNYYITKEKYELGLIFLSVVHFQHFDKIKILTHILNLALPSIQNARHIYIRPTVKTQFSLGIYIRPTQLRGFN